MAMSITMADNNDVDHFCGANVNAAFTDAMKDDTGLMAEAAVCNMIRYDATTDWALIGAVEKVLMTEYVARSIALAAIAYDMSGFTTRLEAEDMMNIHVWRLRAIEKLLTDQKTLTFIRGGTP